MSDDPPLHVVATAGHVDHGKSALILRLTGMDPDRWAEEKRRGLTIDLGFAWTTLPSGREIGFVDVPGHERFIRNMLAGVGPVRLVLFVVAADEGWKPQSEEHLQIVDVLGVEGAVIALTKRDLVDADSLAARRDAVRSQLSGTRLADAPVVACSSYTGEGLDELRRALDEMIASAPPPETNGRPRQFVDRVFTIKGAGTVVTGTLAGGPISVGEEAVVLPTGHTARIRSLQTHKRAIHTARPVSRVAVNLSGTAKQDLARGDVLTLPGRWRATEVFEGWIRPVRGIDRPLTARGAYKLYVGSAERDARLRLYDLRELLPGGRAYVRVTLSRPVVADVGDAFVLREAGRRETVAGGGILDAHPPARPGPDSAGRLAAREHADRGDLAWRLVADRGAVRASEVAMLAGGSPGDAVERGAISLGTWMVTPELVEDAGAVLVKRLNAYHSEHPLRGGLELPEARSLLATVHPLLADAGLVDELLARMDAAGKVAREGTLIRLPVHRVTAEGREDADLLVKAVADEEPTPPSARELMAAGFARELIGIVCDEGRLVRISPDVIVTPAFLARAEEVVRAGVAEGGMTVSSFREALGTSRRYAVPILEFFDARGFTRRDGDVRFLGSHHIPGAK